MLLAKNLSKKEKFIICATLEEIREQIEVQKDRGDSAEAVVDTIECQIKEAIIFYSEYDKEVGLL